MSEVYDRQKMQSDIQKSDEFANVFGKLISGKSNYKAVIESKPIIIKCKNCDAELQEKQKFCHECGAKNEGEKK